MERLRRNWPLALLLVFLLILLLQKYVFPLNVYYPEYSRKPKVTLYSNPTYYNAILPWLSLDRRQRRFHLVHKNWINIARLQYQIRHDQGELWITSLESAAQAWQHGADIKILMVMGWRKWNLVSTLPEEELFDGQDRTIYFPQYSNAACNVLRDALETRKSKIGYVPMDLPRLLEKLQKEQIDTAVLQTPLGAYMQMVNRNLQTSIPLETFHVEKTGKPIRFPWIVLSVRGEWARQHPDLVGYIQMQLRKESYLLNMKPIQEITRLWEAKCQSDLPADLLAALLKNERLQSTPALEAEEQIRYLLRLTSPHVRYSPALLWHPPLVPRSDPQARQHGK